MNEIQANAVRSNSHVEAELIGSNTCVAGNVKATANAPALALCRQLLAQGLDPDAALHVYRAGQLALKVASIRRGAGLTIEDDEYGTPRLRKIREESRGGASLVRESEFGHAEVAA